MDITIWASVICFCYYHCIRGNTDSKDGKKLQIDDEEDEFDQNILSMGIKFRIEYEPLVDAYNSGNCHMMLIKNVIISPKRGCNLIAQPYTIFTLVVDEIVRIHPTDLHKKIATT